MATNPLMLLAPNTPTEAPAQLGAAGAPSVWENFMSGTNEFMNDPTKMALMLAGLSLLSGESAVKAGTTGAGMYQQLMQQQKANEEADRRAGLDELNYGLNERRVGQGDEQLKLDRDRLNLQEKELAQKEKALLAKDKAPTGADDKLWKQALDTAMTELEPGDTMDVHRVYEIYNSISGGNPLYAPFGKTELDYYVGRAEKNPDKADALGSILEGLYGPRAVARYNASWDKRRAEIIAKQEADAAEAAKKTAAAKEESLAKSPTTAPITGNQAVVNPYVATPPAGRQSPFSYLIGR